MQPGMKLVRDICLLSALIVPALSVPSAWSQTAAPASGIVDKLAGLDTAPDLDPPIAPLLSKLPQVRFDVAFDPDTSIVRPASYQTIGSIADALYDPKLQPYRFLIVDHVASAGRRDHNRTLTQRRADAIREILVTTFNVSPKRLQALGLGEEQLQDINRPASPANARAQIIAVGKMEIAEPKPATAPAAQKGAAAKKKR